MWYLAGDSWSLVALNWIDTTGGTYQILNFVSWTAFTFLPVLIAVTASKKFNVNVFIAVVIACALVSPDYILPNGKVRDPVKFLGIPVQLLSYTSSVIPIILAIWIASYVQKFLCQSTSDCGAKLFTQCLPLRLWFLLLCWCSVGWKYESAEQSEISTIHFTA